MPNVKIDANTVFDDHSHVRLKRKKKTPSQRVDWKSVDSTTFIQMRKKYFNKIIGGDANQVKCIVQVRNSEGNLVECGKVYSNCSSDTKNKHLSKHVGLQEFQGAKLVQGTLDQLVSSDKDHFKNLAVSLVINNNLSFNVLESTEWNAIVTKIMCKENFGSHSAKSRLHDLVVRGTSNLLEVIKSLAWYSISEDEGTVNNSTIVLHGMHYCCSEDLSINNILLRYFETDNKEAVTLCGHWNETIRRYKLNKTQITAFESDQALYYVPRGLGVIHSVCGVHMGDLVLEDNYVYIQEEVDKAVAIRKFVTVGSNEKIYFTKQLAAGLPEKRFPINSMVRFVTHRDSFTHIVCYQQQLIDLLEEKGELDLVLKDTEIETYREVANIFDMMRNVMDKLQSCSICYFMPLFWGIYQKLVLLQKNETRFPPRSGQLLFISGVKESILKRITDTQLTQHQRDLMMKAMLMEPYIKPSILEIFPTVNKQTVLARSKRELLNELTQIIRKKHESQVTIRDLNVEEPNPKKKKVEDDFLSFLAPNEDDEEEPVSTTSKDKEYVWFKKYLDGEQICLSSDASNRFWLDLKEVYPSCFSMVLKYRSILSSSIFEEQCFSQIGRIVTEDRESLKPETVEEIMFYKKNQSLIYK